MGSQEDWWNHTPNCPKPEASIEAWGMVLDRNLSSLTLLEEQRLGILQSPLLWFSGSSQENPPTLSARRVLSFWGLGGCQAPLLTSPQAAKELECRAGGFHSNPHPKSWSPGSSGKHVSQLCYPMETTPAPPTPKASMFLNMNEEDRGQRYLRLPTPGFWDFWEKTLTLSPWEKLMGRHSPHNPKTLSLR